MTFETRSGNVSRAQKDWSPWAKLSGDRVASPAARFLQYRATVSGAAELYDVTAAYEMKNVAPVIEAAGEHARQLQVPASGGRVSGGSAALDAAAAGPHEPRVRAGTRRRTPERRRRLPRRRDTSARAGWLPTKTATRSRSRLKSAASMRPPGSRCMKICRSVITVGIQPHIRMANTACA